MATIQASTRASSCHASYRPLRPPCPAAISVFSRNGPPGASGLQPGDPFRRLGVEHPGVVEAGDRQHRGIGPVGGDVLVRRVRLHVPVDLGVVQRVAPLLPLGHRERQGRIQDAGQRVHERDLGDRGAEGVRGEVQRRAHQQAARRAAPRDQPPRRRPALAGQVPRARHEVGERVDLAQHLAVVVPPAAQLTPAADMRDRVTEPPVQQGQPRDREARVDRDLVAAVAVEDERGPAVARRARPADQRDRHAGAVRRGGPQPVLLVLGRVVLGPARQRQHRAAPQQGQLTGLGVAVVHRVGRDQGAVAEPVGPRAVLRVRPRRDPVDRLGEGDLVLAAVGPQHPQPGQPVFAQVNNEVVSERVHAEQPGVVAVGYQRRPGRPV